MSRVDVIIPCYNYAHFLRACGESVLSQTGVELRVLIIDDASPDHTPDVCRELAANDPRVEFRRHSRNIGHILTYNEGLKWATGDYLLLLSADDLLTPGALCRAVYVLDNYPEVTLTCGRAVVIENDGHPPEVPIQNNECNYQIITGLNFIEKSCRNSTVSPLWTPTAVVRNSIQKKIGGYNISLPHAGDLEMWLCFACYGSIAVLDAWQAYYRKHESNMHYAREKMILGNSQQHLSAFESFFQEYGDKIADKEKMQQIYCKSFAQDAFISAGIALEQGEFSDYRVYMAFARAVYPGISKTQAWYRMQAKKLLGPSLVGLIRTLRNYTNKKASRAIQANVSL